MRDLVIGDVVARSKAAVSPQDAYGGHTPPPALAASPDRWMQQLEVRLLELQRKEEDLSSKVSFWTDKGIDPDTDWSVYRQLMEARHDITWTAIRKSEVGRRVGIDNSDHLYVSFLKAAIEEHRARKEADGTADDTDTALWAAIDGEFNF
jgi:hypothetical protein